jgi:hypothetical protein
MKTYIYIFTAIILLAVSCEKMNELEPQGGHSLTSQVVQTNQTIPSRVNASFNGMFTKLGAPESVLGGGRPDDWGFIMIGFSGDIEAADMVLVNSGYN